VCEEILLLQRRITRKKVILAKKTKKPKNKKTQKVSLFPCKYGEKHTSLFGQK
jgi:hypothetical protein